MAPNNQQLERRGSQALVDVPAASPVDGMITSAKDLVSQLTKAQRQFNVLSPVTSTSKLADGYAAAMSVVPIDLDPDSADVYKDNLMKADEVALTKISLMRLCASLGISWLDTRRLDNGRERFYWNVQVTGEYRAADGTLQRIVASKEVDFRDGSTQIAGKSSAEISRMRQHGQQLAETKAQLRAVRTLGVKSKYKREELEKPFLIVRFSYVPDMSNPEVARMVTAANLGIAAQLYGAAPERAAVSEGEGPLPAELGGGASAPKQIGASKSEAKPAAAAGPKDFADDDVVGALRFRVTRVLDQNAAGDFTIFLGDGSQLLTNDKAVAVAANRAMKSNRAITCNASQGRVDELVVLDEEAPTQGPAGDAAAAEDGLRTIADVQEKAGETNGRKWVKFTIVAVGGESWVTFSKTMADDARHAKANGWKVRFEEKQNEKYPDQMDLVSLTPVDPRQGTLLGGEGEKY